MKRITFDEISKASKAALSGIKDDLVNDLLNIENFFNVFLKDVDLSDKDLNTPDWMLYRYMMDEHDRIESMITSCKYFIQNNRVYV